MPTPAPNPSARSSLETERHASPILVAWLESPVGLLLAGTTEQGIALLELTEEGALEPRLEAARRRLGRVLVPGEHPHLDQLRTELDEYFAGKRRELGVPLDLTGTPFELAVWNQLLQIPYGETCSYEDVALAIGHPGGQRAVGVANGRNPVAIVVPCHRVVNKNGKLGGYGGGLWRKRHLLALEQRHSGLFAGSLC